jgi:hypothetical protein
MSAYYHVMVGLQRVSSNPKDTVWNNWHFRSDAIAHNDDDIADINTALLGLYQDSDLRLSPYLSGTGELKHYDMSQPEPRAPIYDSTFLFSPDSVPGLPCELAVCLSYHAPRTSGVNMARRRGRIYMGPFSADWLHDDGADNRPSTTLLDLLSTHGAALLGNLGTTHALEWVVYSPTEFAETGLLSVSCNGLDGGWIDNAWDIQRRRGAEATARVLFP